MLKNPTAWSFSSIYPTAWSLFDQLLLNNPPLPSLVSTLTIITWPVHEYNMWPSVSFVDELKMLPAPEIAVKYYTQGDLYLFGKSICHRLCSIPSWLSSWFSDSIYSFPDEFQTSRAPKSRRPKIGNNQVLSTPPHGSFFFSFALIF